ncbi:hypothetical protein EV193_10657 [Herbihabitans rhizosphaerae]|uniref:DUF6801 domain-containing protein n=1 Tax=Herbihabitans rhizosphaerae TaxID=1872711 RepID=A0A4V2ES98_9PSEU|nr:DUF6801 domain-containing protein [Herbihabitans rhizosphaerae]RZS36823.1 hypothetical protein EV193_10657 [Herbihabitans rhizosphaerae]
MVIATGKSPALTFPQTGSGKLAVGDIEAELTPKKADGTDTGLSTFNANCEQGPGQDNTVATFKITDGHGTPDATKVTRTTALP